jgi:hypothetical protein
MRWQTNHIAAGSLTIHESMQKCGAITLKQQVGGAGLQMDENPLAYRHPTLLHALTDPYVKV